MRVEVDEPPERVRLSTKLACGRSWKKTRSATDDTRRAHDPDATVLCGDDIDTYGPHNLQKSGGNANAIPFSRRTHKSYSFSILSRHCFLAWLLQ